MNVRVVVIGLAGALCLPAFAADGCGSLPGQNELKKALSQATNDEGSGLNMNMWATIG